MTNFDSSLVYNGKSEKEGPAGLCFPVDLLVCYSFDFSDAIFGMSLGTALIKYYHQAGLAWLPSTFLSLFSKVKLIYWNNIVKLVVLITKLPFFLFVSYKKAYATSYAKQNKYWKKFANISYL